MKMIQKLKQQWLYRKMEKLVCVMQMSFMFVYGDPHSSSPMSEVTVHGQRAPSNAGGGSMPEEMQSKLCK